MSYITASDLAAWVSLSTNVDATSDLTVAANAACSAVDLYCGRHFNLAPVDGDPEARIFTSLTIDDLADTTDLIVEVSNDRATWSTVSATAYWIGPDDALRHFPPQPYYVINPILPLTPEPFVPFNHGVSPFECYQFVRVTSAVWGWPGASLHSNVTQAALLMGAWLFARTGAPFATVGTDLPVRIARGGDPDVCNLLDPLRRVSRIIGV